MRFRVLPVAAGLVLTLGTSLGLVACGNDPAGDPTADRGAGTPSSQPSTGGPVTDPTPREKQPGTARSTTTVTGVVVGGVEAGCLLLDTGTETLLLVGAPPQDVPDGARVRVTGTRDPGLMTTCQQGVPFRVQLVRPVRD